MPVLRNENERDVYYLASYLNKNRFFRLKTRWGQSFTPNRLFLKADLV